MYELAMPATEPPSAILPADITHITGMARPYRCFTCLKDTIFRRISLYELDSCTSWPNVEAGLLYELAMPATEQLSAILPADITHIAGMARSYRCLTCLKNTIFRRRSLYELASGTSRPHLGAGLLYELAMPATEPLSAILPADITHITGMARSYRCFTCLKNTIFRRISLYELSSCTSWPCLRPNHPALYYLQT